MADQHAEEHKEDWDESPDEKRARAGRVYDRLMDEYPEATVALDHGDPYELTVATILSAQTTDERVNEVTPEPGGPRSAQP